jgi:hypothetical protein
MARLLIDDVTVAKIDQIHLHVRFRGGQTTSLTIPIPATGWPARRTLTPSPSSTGSSTITPTPKSLTPSTPLVNAPARTRRATA